MLSREEKVFFKTSDNLKLCGILSKPQKVTDKCIILCHGIGNVDKEEDGIFTALAKKLADTGFAVFRFDFRGHGESEGEQVNMTIRGEAEDLEAAMRFLQEKGYKEFGVLGASFAGGAVSLFASKHTEVVKALVLWNALIDYASLINPVTDWEKKYGGQKAFVSIKKFGFTKIGSSGFKAGKGLMDEIIKLKPYGNLLKLDIPILFVHGNKDTYVPYGDSNKYVATMKNAELVTIEGAEHGFHDRKEDAEKADKLTIEFFTKYL